MSAHANAIRYSAAPCRDDRSPVVLFERALERGRRGQAWWQLGRRPRCLLSLQSALSGQGAILRHDAVLQTVAIDRIEGSEGRPHDFDGDFNPLQDSTRDRWLGIASAVLSGQALPPVSLIWVAGRYFVRDGHHRISVARALGQGTITAYVAVWRAEEPCFGEQGVQAAGS